MIGEVHQISIGTEVNGQAWRGEVPAEEVLLDFLRGRLGLRGTKRSCESEVCGACTVLVDGRPFSSCSYLAFEVDGRQVLTVEGLGGSGGLDPLQTAFVREVAGQCGYCTPGQLLAARGLLNENPHPSHEEIAEWMSGNICRCGCYPAIARAIKKVSEPDMDKE